MGNRQNKSVYKAGSPIDTTRDPRLAEVGDLSLSPARHQGSILDLCRIGNTLISCSDDNTIGVSEWNNLSGGGSLLGNATQLSHLTGHTRAVNRLSASRINNNTTPICWSASRDLSIRCVSFLPYCNCHIITNLFNMYRILLISA